MADVDLRDLKAAARRLYPPGHPVREALLREPDVIPREQAAGKLTAYLHLVYACD